MSPFSQSFDTSSEGMDGDQQIFQMLWDCRFCGTTKLLGLDHRHCPNCGAPQNPEWRYFPSDADMKFVTDPNYKYSGVDKICPYCQQPNSAAAKFCVQCGGDLSKAQDAARKDNLMTGEAGAVGVRDDVELKRWQADMGLKPNQTQLTTPKDNRRTYLILGLIALIAVILIGGFIYLSRSTVDTVVQFKDATWERIIYVERLTASGGDGWRDSVPGAAYGVSCTTRDRAYTETIREQCGYENIDRGDGSGIRQPKYCDRQITKYRPDQWCSYTVNRWVSLPDLRASGTYAQALLWPDFRESLNLTSVGAQRQRGREQILKVVFTDISDKNRGKEYTYTTDDDQVWLRFKPGQRYSVKVNLLGQIQWDTLQPR